MSTDLPIKMLQRKRNQKMPDGVVLVLVRMPKAQRDHLRAAAKASFRSLTGEINRRLEASIANEPIDEHGVIVVHAGASGQVNQGRTNTHDS